MSFREGHFIPYETPTPKSYIQEFLERKQIAWVRLNPDPRPDGVPALGLELTDTSRVIVFAVRTPVTLDCPWNARLFWRLIPAQRIVTPRMHRFFEHGEDVQTGGGVIASPEDTWWRQLRGAVILGVLVTKERNEHGGEHCALEAVQDGRLLKLRLCAWPDPEGAEAAELDCAIEHGPRVLVVPMGWS